MAQSDLSVKIENKKEEKERTSQSGQSLVVLSELGHFTNGCGYCIG